MNHVEVIENPKRKDEGREFLVEVPVKMLLTIGESATTEEVSKLVARFTEGKDRPKVESYGRTRGSDSFYSIKTI
jgi:hypothetical protein